MKRAPETIDVELITVSPHRVREINEDAVRRIADSIAEIGLMTPITLLDVNDGERLDLVAGAHRLAACKLLGLVQIDAFIIEGDELEARIWEVAENLHRADLTKAQRDVQIRLYAELLKEKEAREIHVTQNAAPEIGYGKPPPQTKGVALKIAEQTGLSKDTIRRALNPQPIKPTKVADAPVSDEQAVERQVATIIAAWNKASPEARAEFMARIDVPVMGRRAA